MKRIIALFTAVLICVFSLASCSDKAKGSSSKNAAQVSSTEQIETIKQLVLVDEKDIKVVTKSITQTKKGKTLSMEVENSSDKAVEVGIINSSINGYMIPSDSTVNVDTGETAYLNAVFDEIKLMNSGITTFAEIELQVSVKDSETGDEIIVTKPYKLKTSAAEGFEYNYDTSGTVAYDNNNIRIIIKDIFVDEYAGQCVNVFVDNSGEKNISISLGDTYVNGKKADAMLVSDVLSRKCEVSQIVLENPDGFGEIKKLKTSFTINDSDTGDVIEAQTDAVTVKF
ncbi:MAG: hypothetical protein K6F88_07325 [Ruminococcus sp.]|nr:hypothetical protein [Ruminococcus sp.]